MSGRDGGWRRDRLARARLYVCTPLRDDLEAFLDAVLGAGVDVAQLRDKHATPDAQRAAAPAFRAACRRHDALFVVNDDPALGAECDADGVHVGQHDPSPAAARATVGPDRIVGLSTHSTAQFDAGLRQDVDYLAIGPVRATPTKQGRPGIGVAPVRHAARVAGDLPWFVTGGMAAATAPEVLAAGARGLVVVRAITHARDPAAATAAIRALL